MNVLNRTMFIGDNLEVLRGMDGACFDLIYLDPPFNSKKQWSAPIGSKAAGAHFRDRWTYKDIDDAWIGEIAEEAPKLYNLIMAVKEIGGKPDASYLIYMAPRLMEMHRVLKITGSLYLHCDPVMSHSLKLLLDAIFGAGAFRNEIVWFYPDSPGRPTRDFARKHDIILRYGKSAKDFYFNRDAVKIPIKEASKKRYELPRTIGGKTYYSGDTSGKVPESVWPFPVLKRNSRESVGYPTQKPLALLERIVSASCPEGGFVLDPFAGCATTCIAAEKLGRQWVGIDLSALAGKLVKARFKQKFVQDALPTLSRSSKIHLRSDIPVRSDGVVRSRNIKHTRYGEQEGRCTGCMHHFEIQNLETDHIVPTSRGGADSDENIQLLCGSCNKIKGEKDMANLKARLIELGIIERKTGVVRRKRTPRKKSAPRRKKR